MIVIYKNLNCFMIFSFFTEDDRSQKIFWGCREGGYVDRSVQIGGVLMLVGDPNEKGASL
jgi:hypothetical protein